MSEMKTLVITIPDAVKLTGMPRYAIDHMIKEKKIKYVKSGKKYFINRESLIRYVGGENDEG